jgi:hypothetical protein
LIAAHADVLQGAVQDGGIAVVSRVDGGGIIIVDGWAGVSTDGTEEVIPHDREYMEYRDAAEGWMGCSVDEGEMKEDGRGKSIGLLSLASGGLSRAAKKSMSIIGSSS